MILDNSVLQFLLDLIIVEFEVQIINEILEGNRNFTLTINPSSLPSGVNVGDPGQATVVMDDNGELSIIYII